MIFDTYPRLENDTLILKKMTLQDLPGLEQMLGEKDVYRYEPTYLPELLSVSARQFIEQDCDRLFREKEGIILGIYLKEKPDELIGIGEIYGYSPERSKASIGYRLKTEYWHRGIATSVAALLRDHILNELKLERITAHVRVENPASEHCLLNNGFVRRRDPHEEDWGYDCPVLANKYVIYPAEITADELLFLSRDPEIIPLYRSFLIKLCGSYPEIKIKVGKTQISFTNRHVFACISFLRVRPKKELPPHYLVLTLGLPELLDSPRAAAATEPYPGRWTTHIVLGSGTDLDAELFEWIDRAYRFSEEK